MARSAAFDPLENFRFQVSLNDSAGQPTLTRSGFSTCTPPSEATGEITYREGQYRDAMEKSAGLTTYNNVTLGRGVTQDQDFYSWVEQHKKHAANVRGSDGAFTANDVRPSDDASNSYRRTLVITVLNRESQAVKRWTLYNCHVASFTPGDSLDANSEAKLMTSLELRYESYEEEVL